MYTYPTKNQLEVIAAEMVCVAYGSGLDCLESHESFEVFVWDVVDIFVNHLADRAGHVVGHD